MNEFRVQCAYEIIHGYLLLHPGGQSLLNYRREQPFTMSTNQTAHSLGTVQQSLPSVCTMESEIQAVDNVYEYNIGDENVDTVSYDDVFDERDEKTDQEFF